MGINLGGLTDIGRKRKNNQDCFFIREFEEDFVLMIVCDGMGGAAGGSEASRLAADTFAAHVESNIKRGNTEEYLSILENALDAANKSVVEKAKSEKELEGMGTTIVCAIFDKDTYYCLWVGDSRIYAITADGIMQISHDHSFVQTLVDNGSITAEEALTHPNRNIITKAVGTEASINADVARTDSVNINGLLLCSDGLCGYVPEDVISGMCLEKQNADECCEVLVALANEAGGYDNITVVVHKKH